MKQIRPDIVHTRNLAALEATFTAALAGVPVRIHGEHGRDVADLDGMNRRYRLWRRIFKPFVHQYIALSKELERYLCEQIGVPSGKVMQLYNGVDTELFHPARAGRQTLPCAGFAPADAFVIGTVGRMEPVKDPLNLVRAFVILLKMVPAGGRPVRLVIVGNGSLRAQVADALAQAGAASAAWLPGERDDVAQIMRGLDAFVLPSLGEGISNTVLEAMASGLPVVATAVGGNPELVIEGLTGLLVPRANPQALAEAMFRLYMNSAECRRFGREARAVVEHHFGISGMVNDYLSIYDRMPKRQRNGRMKCAC